MWPIATTRPVAIDRTRTICCHNINRTSFYNDRNLSIRWRETQRLARCHRSNLIRDTAPAGSRSVVPTVNCQLPPLDLDSFGGTHLRGLQRQPLAGVSDCTACPHSWSSQHDRPKHRLERLRVVPVWVWVFVCIRREGEVVSHRNRGRRLSTDLGGLCRLQFQLGPGSYDDGTGGGF